MNRQVEGETRVGVFASKSIEVGEPLTYDYRYATFSILLLFFLDQLADIIMHVFGFISIFPSSTKTKKEMFFDAYQLDSKRK